MSAIDVDRFGADSSGMFVRTVLGKSGHEVVCLDGLQDAERVEGVLLLEPVRAGRQPAPGAR